MHLCKVSQIWFFSILIMLSIQFSYLCAEESVQELHLERGYSLFNEALQEKNIVLRVKLLNEALSEYLEIQDATMNSEICANIGAIYFYLGDTALSTLYLFRAQSLAPRHLAIQQMLQSLQKFSNLQGRWFPFSLIEYLYGTVFLSRSERIAILLFLLLITSILISFSIWFPYSGIKRVAVISGILSSITLLLFFLFPFFNEKERVIVQERSYLKMSEALQSATSTKLSTDALDVDSASFVIPGEELIVLSKDSNSEWLRVETARGNIGYISGKSTRPLL